jgi:hypothetical protein
MLKVLPEVRFTRFFLVVPLLGLGLVIFCSTCLAQLPPTNYGKFVHQPGDNQYDSAAQTERHGSQPVFAGVGGSPGGQTIIFRGAAAAPAYVPTPPPPRADLSIQPVVADEPLKPAGFPPLPDRLDLAVANANWGNHIPVLQGATNGGTSGGGTPGGEVVSFTRNYGSTGCIGVHEHYNHYNAGAFIPKQELEHRIYQPASSDYYSVKSGGNPAQAQPVQQSPATNALRQLGREPNLGQDVPQKPEVPRAVTVNQAVTQDLSLPDDQFNQQSPVATKNSSGAGRFAKSAGRAVLMPVRSVGYSAVGMMSSYGAYAIRR